MKPSYEDLEQQLRRIGQAAKSSGATGGGLMVVALEISRGNDLLTRLDSATETLPTLSAEMQLRRICQLPGGIEALTVLSRELASGSELLSRVDAAKAEPAVLPTVILEINGGVVNLARSTAPLRLVVLDADTESAGDNEIVTVDGDEFYMTDLVLAAGSDPGFGGVAPVVVMEMLEQLPQSEAPADAGRAPHPAQRT